MRMSGNMPAGITVKKAEYQPVYAEWIIPDGAKERKAILYFQSGGFGLGNMKSHRSIVGSFVKTVGYKALLFDYRLDPEFPVSAAIDDSAEIYRWMLEQGYRPEDIIFAGDSSGGGIEIGTMLKLRDEGTPLPAACIAFSPSLDNEDSKHPYSSPLFADLTGLPPIMIHVGNEEVLRDDSTSFGENADYYGVDVRVRVWKGMFHCFPLLAPMFEEATEAMKQVKSFINRHMENESDRTAAFLYMLLINYY